MRRSVVVLALVLLAVLFPVNAGAIQAAGAGATAWWVIGALLFALPSTVVIVTLAARDGSPFTSLARGGHLAHAGALGIWVAGTLAVLAAAIASVTYAERAFSADLPTAVEGSLAVILAALGVLSGRLRAWGGILAVGAVALALVVLIGVMAVVVSTDPVQGSAAEQGGWLSLDGWSWLGLVVLGLVGAHLPYQRAGLRPVSARAVAWGMVAVIVGYIGLTLAFATALPSDVAMSFTSLADLGATMGSAWGTVAAVLVAVSFAAATLGLGASFDELGHDLRLPRPATIGLVLLAGAACVVVAPLVASDDVAVRGYAVLQGAATLLWAFGYVALGGLAIRQGGSALMRLSGWATAILGSVGIVGVLSGPFTPLIADDTIAWDVLGSTFQLGAWALWIVVVAAIAIGIAWATKAEADHLTRTHDQ